MSLDFIFTLSRYILYFCQGTHCWLFYEVLVFFRLISFPADLKVIMVVNPTGVLELLILLEVTPFHDNAMT